MARRKRRRELPDDELDEDLEDELDAALDEDDDPPPRPRRRRRNWRRRFVIFVLLVAALIAAAPTIVAKTPLRNLLLGKAVAGSSAQVAARDASFSWTGAQGLAGVTLADAQGAPLTTIELVTLDRSLIGLASNQRDLGKITIHRPVIHLETRAGGSNFEDLIQTIADAARQHRPQSSHDAGPTIAEIEITGGTIHGRDAATGQQWRIDDLTAAAKTSPDGALAELTGAGVLTLTIEPGKPDAQTHLAPNSPGHFQFRLTCPDPASADSTTCHLELIADRLPLAPVEPWLARILPGARITGAASTDLKLTWTPPTSLANKNDDATVEASPSDAPLPAPGLKSLSLSAAGKLDAADLRFTAAALEGDLIELPTAAIAIDVQLADGQLSAKRLAAECPWLEVEGSGDLNLAQLVGGDWRELPANDANLTASVDLPQLARMLPRTLNLRPGVKIDSGAVEVTARSTRADAGRRWTVAASIDNLLGTDGRREIRWTQPVEAGFDAAETRDGPQLQRAIFRSSFASATAEAVDEGYRGELSFNMSQLAEQLGKFVDLSHWKLAGAGTGEFTLRNTGDDRFVAVAKLDLKDIDVRAHGRIVWLDPELRVEANANGRRLGVRPQRLETATALMRSPRDTLEAELVEPVDLAAANRQFAVRIKGDGPLDSWAGRLRPWVAGVPDELTGASTVNAEVRAGPGLVEVVSSTLKVRDMRTRVGAVEIVEPRLEAGGDFRWAAADRAINSKNFQFATSTVAARIGDLSLRESDSGPPTVRGEVAFRGDLERLAAWLGLAGAGATTWPRGQAVGSIDLASDADRATATITMTVEPFTLLRAPSSSNLQPPASSLQPAIAWHEPKLELSTSAVYTSADDRLDLADIRLQGQTIQLTGRGAVEQLRTAGLVRGDVNLTYAAAEFAKLLAGYLGPGVRIEGANTARLQATGRLVPPPSQGGARGGTADATMPPHVHTSATLPSHWSQRWQINTETGWSAANLYGLPIGAAKLAANLRDGQLQLTPLDLAVGPGRITTAPRARLDPPPQELTIPPGPLVSNVAISREVSEAMLKYAAPVLASATRTEGSFSLFLDSGAQIPLGDPQKTRAAGRLTIHRLSVLPGPMLQEVTGLISRVEALSKRRPEGLLGVIAPPPADRGAGARGITMNERTIDVQIVDGRVYHRNLEFLVDDVPVRSFGSVGFDQTLALEIEVPVQAKWVGSERALQPLIGQVIRIPVSGTFTRWKIDERAIGQFLTQAAQTAVGGALEGELNKALDKLLKPR